MIINNDVSNVLLNSNIDGNLLFLPPGQLERKLYIAVNKVLDAINGKWNRAKKAHIFKDNPEEILNEILLTGQYTNSKTEYQFFETPSDIAKKLVLMADIRKGESVLEPQAGKARIASLINGCDCIELNPDNRKYLSENGYNIVGDDFLKFSGRYDVIIANPPFTNQQDIDHVLHMIAYANRCVVSVMSASVMFRDNQKTVDFRNLIKELGGTIKSLPDDSFKESGTLVKTCVVKVNNLNQ